MKNAITLSAICIVVMLGCMQPRPAPRDSLSQIERPNSWPNDWSTLVGQKVTLEGWASELKLGSMLVADKELHKNSIWIDGNRWPDGYYQGPGERKHLRVTGTVIKRDDKPIVGPGGVPEGAQGTGSSRSFEETQRMKWRYLLKDATWTVLD